MRNLGIRWRILGVVALPVALLLMVVVYAIGHEHGAVGKARDNSNLASLSGDMIVLVQGLQQERALSIAVASGNTARADDLKEVQQGIDEGISRVDNNPFTNAGTALHNAELQRSIDLYRSRLASERLPEIRDAAKTSADPVRINRDYTSLINSYVFLPKMVASHVESPELRNNFETYWLAGETQEALSREKLAAAALFRAGPQSSSDAFEAFSRAAQTHDALRTQLATISLASGPQMPHPPAVLLASERNLSSPTTMAQVNRGEWEAAVNADMAGLQAWQRELAHQTMMVADEEQRRLEDRNLLVVCLGVLAIAIPLLLARILAARISRPLVRLTRAAGQIQEQLHDLVEDVHTLGTAPKVSFETLDPGTGDETGKLARAFDDMNQATLRFANEQAALRASIAEVFINVARRDQVLLSRQLAFIDQLIRESDDPRARASMERLDHLAVRMRRNAESLLVLAGIETGRRRRTPLPLHDVLRLARLETEEPRRIEVAAGVNPLVVGASSLSIVHLVAELMENATKFSGSSTHVRVGVEMEGQEVTLSVSDEGVGMSAGELERMNKILQEHAYSEAIGQTQLGLFVVSRLARNLGARVRLRHRTPAGVRAEVRLGFEHFLIRSDTERPYSCPAPEAVGEQSAVGALPAAFSPASAVPAAREPE